MRAQTPKKITVIPVVDHSATSRLQIKRTQLGSVRHRVSGVTVQGHYTWHTKCVTRYNYCLSHLYLIFEGISLLKKQANVARILDCL